MKTIRNWAATTCASVVAAALSGCGTDEPPKPGVHAGPLEVRADIRCAYEAPTATRFMKFRCEDTKDMADRAAHDQRMTDDIRPPPPTL